MSFIVTENWLNEKLQKNDETIVVIDVRSALNDPETGREAYIAGHIPGAVYLDLKDDLSGEAKKHGGNHPLPDVTEFAAKMSAVGINQETNVIIYDDANGMFAARAWWLLHYMGHESVYVLDGGIKAWIEAGHEITTDIPKSPSKTFIPQIRENATVTMEEVKGNIGQPDSILIDSRGRERYLGNTEPMYAKSGHIPGAKNFAWENVLNENGMWKDVEELKSNFLDLPKDAEIIVSCGSGISACPNIIGLKEAGYTNVKLYPGSFSDWISYDENDVAKGEE